MTPGCGSGWMQEPDTGKVFLGNGQCGGRWGGSLMACWAFEMPEIGAEWAARCHGRN